jgi:outer membrane protein assembly factor BamB
VHRWPRQTACSLLAAAVLAGALGACAERAAGPAQGRTTVPGRVGPSCVSTLRFDKVHSARPSVRLPGAAWRINGDLPVTAPTMADGTVFGGTTGVLPEQGCVFAADTRTGRLRWSAAGGVSPGLRPLVAGDLVVVALQGGDLAGFVGRSGTQRWVVETGGLWEAQPALVDGVLYAASSGGVLALDPPSGRLRWQARGRVGAMVADREAVLVSWLGSQPATAALDPASGRERWRAATGGTGALVVAQAFGTVVLRGAGAALYGLDASTGRRLWKLELPGGGSTPPVAAAGRILYRADDGDAYAVDARSGRVAWRTAVGYGDDLESPAVDGSSLYVGGSAALDDDGLWALDVDSGRVRWRLDTEGPAATEPRVQGDLVLAGDASSWLYAVDRRSGRLRGRYAAGGGVDRQLGVDHGWVLARVDARGLAGIPL